MSSIQYRTSRGVTLVELVVVMAIVGILATIALPSFSTSMRNSRLATMTNEFIGAVNLARSEAVKNNRGAAICATADGNSCGTDWSAGWMVFADPDRNGVRGSTENVFRVQQALNGLSVASASGSAFRFTARGECANCVGGAFGGSDSDLELRAVPCDAGQQHVRAMRILRTGAVSFEKRGCP